MKRLTSMMVITAAMTAAVLAEPGRGGGPWKDSEGGPPGPRAEWIADELDLAPAQRDTLRDLQDAWHMEAVDLTAATQKARLEVRRLMRQTEVDRAAVMKAVEAESAAELALRKARVEHQLKVRDLIGPEKAARVMDMRQGRRGDRGGDGDDDGPPGRRSGFGPGGPRPQDG